MLVFYRQCSGQRKSPAWRLPSRAVGRKRQIGVGSPSRLSLSEIQAPSRSTQRCAEQPHREARHGLSCLRRRDGLQSLAEQDRRLGLQDPCEAIESRQLADCLIAAVQRLPAKQRDIFVLVQIHGYSGHDAAKVMGLSRSNVWVILHRARKTLQSQLHGAYH